MHVCQGRAHAFARNSMGRFADQSYRIIKAMDKQIKVVYLDEMTGLKFTEPWDRW